MSSTPNNAKPAQLVMDSDLLAGLQKNQSTLPSFFFRNATVTPASSIAVLQGRVDKGNAFVVAQGGYLKTAQENRDQVAQTKDFVSDLKAALHLAYKGDAAKLAEFGLVPHKVPPPRTAEQKLVVATKGASTREARHTMGPRAKQKIKGAVPAIVTIEVPGEK